MSVALKKKTSKRKKRYPDIPNLSRRISEQLEFQFDVAATNGNSFRDSAFADNKNQPIHRWVPWIAGFSSQFVQDCFDLFLKNRNPKSKPCILDPFAGVGTTLVRAMLNGYKTIGFEINPYATLACKVKLGASGVDTKTLGKYCEKYLMAAAESNGSAKSHRPQEFKSRIPFFSAEVESQVLTFLDFLKTIRNPVIADIFRLAFGAVMVSFSNYTYEPSLSSRPGAGKPLIQHADVSATILAKLMEIYSDIDWLKDELARTRALGEGTVYNMDFLCNYSVLPANSIDLMVTSPPYMNNYHYIRNTRPQLFWLSLVSCTSDLKHLEEANLGKYWQTVRASQPLKLKFHHPHLSKILESIRETRKEKGSYGGPGWANYVTSYFNDSYRFLTGLKHVLKKGGVGVIVIGNSIIQGHDIQIDLIANDLAEQIGLLPAGIQRIRSKRVGASITQSSVRRGDLNKAQLYESAVILQKK